MAGITDRRRRGGQRRPVRIERGADALHRIHHVRGAVGPADAQRCQAVDLGERARHDHVVAGIDQGLAALIVLPVNVFGVRAVYHQQATARQPRAQPAQFRAADVGAGGVVRVGNHAESRSCRRRCQQGLHIDTVVPFRRYHRITTLGDGVNPHHLEAVFADQDIVAGLQVSADHQQDQFIRAVAADDAARIQAMHLADGVAQFRLRPVRIPVDLPHRVSIGRQRRGARPVRGFVGGQLDGFVHAGYFALPHLVGRELRQSRSMLEHRDAVLSLFGRSGMPTPGGLCKGRLIEYLGPLYLTRKV